MQTKTIYLLQRKEYVLTVLPDWLGMDDTGFWIEFEYMPDFSDDFSKFMKKGEVIEQKLYEYLVTLEYEDITWCVEKQLTDSAWCDPVQAMEYAEENPNKFPFGYALVNTDLIQNPTEDEDVIELLVLD